MSGVSVGSQARLFIGVLRLRDYRLLWLSQLVSEVGDWAARLALTALVFERTHSSLWATLVLVAAMAPMLGPGQLLASLADRVDRRAVMVLSDLARAGVFAVLAAFPSMPTSAILGATLVAGLATVPFEAARSAAVLDVAPKSQAPTAVTLGQATQSLALVVGWAAGGLLLATLGARGALAVNGVSFLASAALLSRLPALRPLAAGANSSLRAAARGLRVAAGALLADRWVRRAAGLAIAAVAPATAVQALVVPAVTQSWRTPALAAVLLGLASLGDLVLSASVSTERGEADLVRRATLYALLPALVAVGLLTTGVPAVQAGGFVASGLAMAALAPAAAALGPRLPAAHRAAAYTLLATGLTTAQMGLTVVGGLVADVTSPATAAALLMLLPVAGGLAALRATMSVSAGMPTETAADPL